MAIEKPMNSRVLLKNDIEANWIKAVNFIPKLGEAIIYNAELDGQEPLIDGVALRQPIKHPRVKIGDGVTNVSNLPFITEGLGANSDIEKLKELVGDTAVSEQISDAVSGIVFPVASVNGKTGDVQLVAADVGALSVEDEISSEHVVHGSSKTLLSNIIENYILTIDYANLLAFNTAEIVINGSSSDNEDAGTSATLGVAVLGQMVLGK